jgi:uncharacterized membrane protein YeaQ/YmgE (transglycosylase-associated protein family)
MRRAAWKGMARPGERGSRLNSQGATKGRNAMENLNDLQLPAIAEQWANTILIWVGFGTLTGLLAKAIMPGRDPGGAVATLAMGIGGTVIGCGTLTFFSSGVKVTPISPVGFIVATAGAFILLFFYRLLAGYWFVEGDRAARPVVKRPHRPRRESVTYVEE